MDLRGGPAPGGKPETFLRAEARDPAGSSEPNPDDNPVQPRSLNDWEIPELDENLRRHTIRLVLPGTQRNPQPSSGQSRTGEPFDQSETVAAGFRSRSPVLPSCERTICLRTCVPTGFTRTSWSLPLSGNGSRTNRPKLREYLGALNP